MHIYTSVNVESHSYFYNSIIKFIIFNQYCQKRNTSTSSSLKNFAPSIVATILKTNKQIKFLLWFRIGNIKQKRILYIIHKIYVN